MEFLAGTFIDDEVALKVKNAFDPRIRLVGWTLQKYGGLASKHFLSQTSRLILTGFDESDSSSLVVSFFVKCPYRNEVYEEYQVGPVADKEFSMYTRVLPAFRAICIGSSEPLPFPRCFYAHHDRSLILEDLRETAYSAYDRRGPYLDVEHAAHALKALAKFHALSARIDEMWPHVLDDVRGIEFLRTEPQGPPKAVLFGNRVCKLIERVDPVFAAQHRHQLLQYKDTFYEKAVAEAAPRQCRFNVLNHGDFWTSNLMFRRDGGGDNSRVESVKFFDFQFSHWSSPANDFFFFCAICVRHDQSFERHLQHLLDVYVDALASTLKRLNSRQTYTVDELRHDIAAKSNYWILLLIWWAPIFHTTEDEFKGDTLDERLVDGKMYQPFIRKWISFFIEHSKKTNGPKFYE